MPTPLRERVMEVRVDRSSSAETAYGYGSGYRIVGNIVLTAAHVVRDAGPAGITVVGVDKRRLRAVLVKDMIGDQAIADLALLEVIEPMSPVDGLEVAEVNQDLAVPVLIERCWAVGYPEFKEFMTPGPQSRCVRETAQADGVVPPAENLIRGLLALRVNLGTGFPPLPPMGATLGESRWAGMSGAAVFAGRQLIGVVAEHVPTSGDSTLGVTPLTHINHLPHPERWWALLGVDPQRLCQLPEEPSPGLPNIDLEAGVLDHYRAQLPALEVAQGAVPPQVGRAWLELMIAQLSVRCDDADEPMRQRHRETAAALLAALDAKAAMWQVVVADLMLARMQALFHQEVGRWPTHAHSFDAMLVEAASATIADRRNGHGAGVSPLAGFVVAVLAECGTDPNSPALRAWFDRTGHQLAEIRHHYEDLRGRRQVSWLLIDLGPEPQIPPSARTDGPQAPTQVSATLFTSPQASIPIRQKYEPSDMEGLLDWLRRVMVMASELAPADGELIVDIAAPEDLLTQGIQHWPVVDAGGVLETLARHCRPLLRWSQRTRNRFLARKLLERARHAQWDTGPAILPVSTSGPRLQEWLATQRERPWVLHYRDGVFEHGVLQTLLREGCPYIVWYDQALTNTQRTRVARAAEGVSPAARMWQVPEQLRTVSPASRQLTLLWDHPGGRGEFRFNSIPLQGPGG